MTRNYKRFAGDTRRNAKSAGNARSGIKYNIVGARRLCRPAQSIAKPVGVYGVRLRTAVGTCTAGLTLICTDIRRASHEYFVLPGTGRGEKIHPSAAVSVRAAAVRRLL